MHFCVSACEGFLSFCSFVEMWCSRANSICLFFGKVGISKGGSTLSDSVKMNCFGFLGVFLGGSEFFCDQ